MNERKDKCLPWSRRQVKLRSECHHHQRKASSSSHVTNKWQIKSPQQSVNAHGCQVIRQTKAVTFYPDHFKKQYFYLSFQLWFQQSIWRLHFATRKIISFCTYSNPPPFPPPTTLGKIAVSLLTILFHRPQQQQQQQQRELRIPVRVVWKNTDCVGLQGAKLSRGSRSSK